MLRKTYTVVHVDKGQSVEAWFPDFPGLTVPGDRLADTLLLAPLVLQKHVQQLRQDHLPAPKSTTPDLWAIHDRYPEALISFADVRTD